MLKIYLYSSERPDIFFPVIISRLSVHEDIGTSSNCFLSIDLRSNYIHVYDPKTSKAMAERSPLSPKCSAATCSRLPNMAHAAPHSLATYTYRLNLVLGMLTRARDKKIVLVVRVMSIISIIEPYSTGWCKSEKLKKIGILQWEILIFKNNHFREWHILFETYDLKIHILWNILTGLIFRAAKTLLLAGTSCRKQEICCPCVLQETFIHIMCEKIKAGPFFNVNTFLIIGIYFEKSSDIWPRHRHRHHSAQNYWSSWEPLYLATPVSTDRPSEISSFTVISISKQMMEVVEKVFTLTIRVLTQTAEFYL